jgi:hypothetical protein
LPYGHQSSPSAPVEGRPVSAKILLRGGLVADGIAELVS